MKTEERLIALMRSQFDDPVEINPDSDLTALGYDSLRFIHLVIKIENEFGIEFNDEDLLYRRFNDVVGIVEYIDEMSGEGAETGNSESLEPNLNLIEPSKT